jgi:hypothetical protein
LTRTVRKTVLPKKQDKAAGEVLTAKQAPRRPGTAPALGLRAGWVAVAILPQTASFKEHL